MLAVVPRIIIFSECLVSRDRSDTSHPPVHSSSVGFFFFRFFFSWLIRLVSTFSHAEKVFNFCDYKIMKLYHHTQTPFITTRFYVLLSAS